MTRSKQSESKTAHRGRQSKSGKNAKLRKGDDPNGVGSKPAKVKSISDSLREEAERRWAKADRATSRRVQRRTAKAKGLRSRRDATAADRKEITGLKAKLRQATEALGRDRRG